MIFFPQKKVRLTSNISNEEFNAKLKEIINNDLFPIKLLGQYDKNTFHITRHVIKTLFEVWYNGKWSIKNNILTLEITIKYEVGDKLVYFVITSIILTFIYFLGHWWLLFFLFLPYAYIASFIHEDSAIVLKCLTKELNANVEDIESKHLFTTLFRKIRNIIPPN